MLDNHNQHQLLVTSSDYKMQLSNFSQPHKRARSNYVILKMKFDQALCKNLRYDQKKLLWY